MVVNHNFELKKNTKNAKKIPIISKRNKNMIVQISKIPIFQSFSKSEIFKFREKFESESKLNIHSKRNHIDTPKISISIRSIWFLPKWEPTFSAFKKYFITVKSWYLCANELAIL